MALSSTVLGSDYMNSQSTLQRYQDYYQHYADYQPVFNITSFKKHLNAVMHTELALNDIIDENTIQAILQYKKVSKFNEKSQISYLTHIYELPFQVKNQILTESMNQMNDILSKKDNKFIIVNIPEFTAMGYELKNERYELAVETPVIIGKTTRKTPLIVSNITAVKFRPTWTPPPTILKQDVYKNGTLNRKYIKEHRLNAYHNGKLVNLDNLTHTQPVSDDNEYDEYVARPKINIHQLKFVQPAGEKNALGVLKFELDNNQNIYLHDTNQHNLFKDTIRAYSSGCVRVQDYVSLASWVLNTSEDQIQDKIETHKSFSIKTEKIPVYIVYWPFSIKNKEIIFLNDIYKLKY